MVLKRVGSPWGARQRRGDAGGHLQRADCQPGLEGQLLGPLHALARGVDDFEDFVESGHVVVYYRLHLRVRGTCGVSFFSVLLLLLLLWTLPAEPNPSALPPFRPLPVKRVQIPLRSLEARSASGYDESLRMTEGV